MNASHGGPTQSHEDHEHRADGGLLARLTGAHTHGHHGAALDAALSSERGIWALKVSLIGLMLTALFQVIIVAISGSVALLADTIHNFSDALTSVPLWLAFSLSRRARNRRYAYGYGRAEDLAGALIVLMILASALVVFYESIEKIANPLPIANLGWVAAAAVIGFIGNELVALFRIRIGRQIQSAALVADGLHSRVGHRQRAELNIVVDGRIPTLESHRIAEEVRHALFHALPALVDATVHIEPGADEAGELHRPTGHHRS